MRHVDSARDYILVHPKQWGGGGEARTKKKKGSREKCRPGLEAKIGK